MRVVADRRYFLLLMGGLIALAWLTLWLWGQSPYGRLLNHDELSGADLSNGLVALVIVMGWTLMIVAMMLPTTDLPLPFSRIPLKIKRLVHFTCYHVVM
jgi:predicted metal-binding membrane protein